MESTPRSRRRKKRVSSTLKQITFDDAIFHLFGKSLKHALDALQSAQWQQENRREKMLEMIPKNLRGQIEALAIQVGKYEEELRTALKHGSIEPLDTRIVPETITSIRVNDLESLRPQSSLLVCNLVFGGVPGNRIWQEVNEPEWKNHLTTEMEYRADYRTEDRHGPKEIKKQLWSMYFRLPPWLATVVGQKLEENKNGLKEAQQIIVDFANAFEFEAGVDCVGIAIHRERGDDFHIHLIFSETREEVKIMEYSPSEMNALVKEIAKKTIAERKASGDASVETGRNKVMAEVRKSLDEKKKIEILRIRKGHPRPWQMLGPSFRGKLALWEMSGRDSEVAACGDRPIDQQNTFRGRIINPILRGQDLTDVFLDLWGERWLTKRMEEILDEGEKAMVLDLGQKAVKQYKEWGKEKPSVEDYIIREMQKYRDLMPDSFSKQFEDVKNENEELHKENSIAKAFYKTLDSAPKQYKRMKPGATVAALVKGVKDFEQLKVTLQRFVIVFKNMISDFSEEALAAWDKLVSLMKSFSGPKKKEPQVAGKKNDEPQIEE